MHHQQIIFLQAQGQGPHTARHNSTCDPVHKVLHALSLGVGIFPYSTPTTILYENMHWGCKSGYYTILFGFIFQSIFPNFWILCILLGSIFVGTLTLIISLVFLFLLTNNNMTLIKKKKTTSIIIWLIILKKKVELEIIITKVYTFSHSLAFSATRAFSWILVRK